MSQPEIVLHVLPPSHPCATVEAALRFKDLDFERIEMPYGKHVELMAEIYGEGNTTVPGAVIDGEPVHGSVSILERLEQIAPDPSLYPADLAERVSEAERWGDGLLQDLGRRLSWGALHFRPESMGTMAPGGAALDPAGTDFAIRFIRASWKYHNITAVQLAEDLQALPGLLDHIDGLIADGVLGRDEPTAADLQIAATLAVFHTIGDLRPLLADRSAGELATKWFDERPGLVPAGAFPAGWVPQPA
ncbi:MAG: glutathione S-transferase [Solirubrobacteraceae bacterium]|nr:glutathione S-transferase [Solirubrobacteraceae bacterium]